ncbi:MAG: hypothetical protein IJZ44_07650 [Lachnospiraceae bacterium]|nr:hypothetical protein [Lachnospiraceae bacterium]
MPDYTPKLLDTCSSCGSFVYDEILPYHRNRYSCAYENLWDRYEEEEIRCFPYCWLLQQRLDKKSAERKLPLTLREHEYAAG